MKSLIRFLLLLLVSLLPSLSYSQLSLDVVYPREDLQLSASDSTFVFGSTSTPGARVTVNGFPMTVFSNGAFLGMVPVSAGEFVLECQALTPFDTVSVSRRVVIPASFDPATGDSTVIDSSYIVPSSDLELEPGDYFQALIRATSGRRVTFSIEGLADNVQMVERPLGSPFYWGESVFGDDGKRPSHEARLSGIYHGMIKIEPDVKLDSAAIRFQLNGTNGSVLSVQAPGRLTVLNEAIPRVGILTSEQTVARTGPALGYQLFLPVGVKMWITGKKAGYYRARLTKEDHIWVPEASIELLPPGTPIPSSEVQLVRTESLSRKTRVKIFLDEALPFKVEQTANPSALIISVYGAVSNTDWIRYDYGDPTIKLITWRQPKDEVYQVVVELNHKQQWGFDPHYEGGGLVVDIKKPPEKFELKKLLICIDPGHGPDDGAVGPTRLTEKDANLQLARSLKQKLEDKGARVFLTRGADHGASLAVRPKLAALMGADLLLSIHHNALPDGVNPFANRGTSTYYYHAQSYPLAVAIQNRLLDELELPNYGLFYNNLALCRPPQMPAVLIESAFIMHPEEELLISTYDYRREAAEAIVKGIEDFLEASKK